nr:envelope stress response membrane protein PspB [uncultured Dongia sp.]
MSAFLEFMFVPAVLFMVIVAPLWLIFHYKTMWRNQKQSGAADEKSFKEMWGVAQRLESRVANLEKLLDAEAPGWREHNK